MTVGDRIRIRRKELNLTQTELAEKLGYKNKASICAIERNKEDLTTSRLARIAAALETTPGHLMGWDDEVSPKRNAGNSLIPGSSYSDYVTLINSRPEISELLRLSKDASKEDLELIITTLKHLNKR